MRYLLPFCLTLFVGCAKDKVHPTDPVALGPELVAKVELYKTRLKDVQGAHGFIEVDQCDALLFSGLLGTVDDVKVDIRGAREDSGRWQRRPLDYPDCYPANSKTSISRDMLLGVLWFAYMQKDLELADNLWSYGQEHGWLMGEGDRDVVWMPEFQATVAQLVYKLGGKDHFERHVNPIIWPSKQIGFRAHLMALHLLLRNRIYGTIEDSGKDFVKEQAERQLKNPLFLCLKGDVTAAIEVLKDEFYWPSDRLPTSEDRCGRWLPERDFGRDWLPCSQGRKHSGGDLLLLLT